MAKLLTTAKNYYWASMVMSLGVVFNLVNNDFIGFVHCNWLYFKPHKATACN